MRKNWNIFECYVPGRMVQAETWFAIAAPGETPTLLLSSIDAAIRSALGSPEVRERLETMSLKVVGNSPMDAGEFVEQEAIRWHAVIDKIGLQAD